MDDIQIERCSENNKEILTNDYFINRNNQIKKYKEKIDVIDNLGKLSNDKISILLSITHMFCNRYNGNNEWEKLVMTLTRHALHDVQAYKRTQKGG